MNELAWYYKELGVLTQMQVSQPGEPCWESRRVHDPAAVVVYLGCNILRTVSLAEQIVQLVQLIESPRPVVALGGPGHCCGSTHAVLRSDPEGAEKRGTTAVEQFRALQPDTVVSWCPVCERRFASYEGVSLEDESFATVHASQYLAENLHRLPRREMTKGRRIAVHQHKGEASSERDAQHAREALGQIPGVELVGGGELEGFGYQCAAAEPEYRSQTYADALDRSIQAAKAAGADTIASVYHGCHRALTHAAARWPDLDFLNFLDPIAESAGVRIPDRYRELVALHDEEAIWSAVGSRFDASREAEVRDIIRRHLLVQR